MVLKFLSCKLIPNTGDRKSLQPAECKFDSIGEDLLTGGIVFPAKDYKALTVAPVACATSSPFLPELGCGPE